MMAVFENIPTNIITGFLGSGKTTAIKHLIKSKPQSESWAVVVNEFGQIGVDGKLLQNTDVAIKEIPGGCLCCVASQSFSAGLNQIIKQQKPQRIIIEPSGLGHPKKLIETLTGEFYASVLDLRAVINLVDARNLSETRYLQHQTFIDQIKMADILVANKLDQYTEKDRINFYQFASKLESAKTHIDMCEHGEVDIDWLDFPHDKTRTAEFSHKHHMHEHGHFADQSIVGKNNTQWQCIEGHADDYNSVGWMLQATLVFSYKNLIIWLNNLREMEGIERIKAILHSDNGWVSINMTRQESEINFIEPAASNILEMISSHQLSAKTLNAGLRITCLHDSINYND